MSKKTSKLHVTGLCVGNSQVTSEFPAQKASNTKKCFHLITSYVDAIMCIYIPLCVMLTTVCTLKSLILIAIGTYEPFAVSAPKIELWEPGINGIIKCIVNDKTKMLNWQQVLELKVSRLCLCKIRVLKYYAENKALLGIWKLGKWKSSIIILQGIKINVKQ